MKKIKKAIFPVAGLGTRFLPATKSIPKEILNLIDRPLIQYAVDEAREAGIEEFIFVTSRGKNALEDYFDTSPGLEAALIANDKPSFLEEVRNVTMESGEIAYLRQNVPKGLGHAVWCARRLVGDEVFAVILTDDVIIGKQQGCLKQMIDAYDKTGGNVVATLEVPQHKTSSYGILDIKDDHGSLLSAKGIVEKPDPANAPSNMAVIGRYLLTPSIMDYLSMQKKGAGGEIQLTDAIAAEVAAGENVYGFRFDGQHYDCGSKAGLLQATVASGLARDDLYDEFLEFLVSRPEIRRALCVSDHV
ncbi:MAG: UTP--glucose-1-phosphate uridylyltransferase GalU [Rhodobacteraceae bacterium]|nr:UTP--glucose-1-phosphate uridylyltransferase GalU [Paracoccaceae bacterium]